MPEGDNVWQAARRLDAGLSGQRLLVSDFRVPSLATLDLSGRQILETVSKGKHLLTRVDGPRSRLSIHSHLKMEGTWQVQPAGSRWRAPGYQARVVLRTAQTEAIGFNVLVDVVETAAENNLVGHLGPDLLGPRWDTEPEQGQAEAVRRLAADPHRPIAEALLDQRHLAGIGNVYQAELCFLSGVHPRTPVAGVPDLRRLVGLARRLLLANRDRGQRVTTGDQRPGRRLWVYGRRGPCLRCGTPIRYDEQGPPGRERVSYWCPSCQPVTS